jgi:hypothetical protein
MEDQIPKSIVQRLQQFPPEFIGDLSGIVDDILSEPDSPIRPSLDAPIDYEAIKQFTSYKAGVDAFKAYLNGSEISVSTYLDLIAHTQSQMSKFNRFNWGILHKRVRDPYSTRLVGKETLRAVYTHCEEKGVHLFGTEYSDAELIR